ncbi:hypothetical protein ECANGB1_1607 [Enterospora canceri]|uniref:Uncharacterized protein n=1 Tax=Enterospora canceri TaxID=1081671 RepID=A0A1Y1S6E9_9MICR|nr:hypothetical protein ECANGB1_1607 [Enterospora canceri]
MREIEVDSILGDTNLVLDNAHLIFFNPSIKDVVEVCDWILSRVPEIVLDDLIYEYVLNHDRIDCRWMYGIVSGAELSGERLRFIYESVLYKDTIINDSYRLKTLGVVLDKYEIDKDDDNTYVLVDMLWNEIKEYSIEYEGIGELLRIARKRTGGFLDKRIEESGLILGEYDK